MDRVHFIIIILYMAMASILCWGIHSAGSVETIKFNNYGDYFRACI